jgi:Radical SAM superfamily
MNSSSGRRIKILRCPDVSNGNGEPPLLPPFSVAVITAFLRGKGFSIEQDDLNVRCFSPNGPKAPLVDRRQLQRLCADHQRVLAYLGGGQDAEIERVARVMLSTTDLAGFDTILLSVCPANEGSSLWTLIIAKCIKATLGALIVVGGEYNQFSPISDMFEEVHEMGVIDFYIHGPGEEALQHLLTALETGSSLAEVRGLVYEEDGTIKRNDRAAGARKILPPCIEGFPLPLYEWKPDKVIRRLLSRHCQDRRVAIEKPSSVGYLPFQLITVCPNRCAFCSASGVYPSRDSIMDPGEAVTRLGELSERYGTKNFFFLDDSLNISRKYMESFCDELIQSKLGLRWSDCVRANNLDEGLLIKMREAGAVRLVIGLESASPRMLEFINKRVSREQVAQVLKWTHNAGIMTSIEFIAGFPTETDDDIQASIDFLEQNRDYIDEAYSNPFFLERNSLMFLAPDRYGIKNIRSERTVRTSRGSLLGHPNVSFMFDEIDGLAWNEKSAQIMRSFLTLGQAISNLGLRPVGDFGLSVLFYLHSILSDDNDVRALYSAYVSKVQFQRIFSMPRIVKVVEEFRAGTSMRERFVTVRQSLGRLLGAMNREFKSSRRPLPHLPPSNGH